MILVTDFFKDINICYLILNILLLIVTYIYLNYKKISKNRSIILLFCLFMIICLSFSYFNNIINSIFDLKYLSIKGFLVVFAITDIIVLITINKNIKLLYAIFNYVIFIYMTIIFMLIIFIRFSNNIIDVDIINIRNVVLLIDGSFVVFSLYLIIIALIYIGSFVFKDFVFDYKKIFRVNKKYIVDNNSDNKLIILSNEELLNYKDKNNFYINDVDASIIFLDSNYNNIISNYHILLNDIEAPLVNGFTLRENKLLKNICTKLNIYNLNDINIYNLSILNRISVEEYNLLKKIKNIN